MSDKNKDAQGELPAKRVSNSSDPRDEAHAAGWNACLAAVRASQVSAAAPAALALRTLCYELDGMKRRMRHTPGSGQNDSYLLHDDVAAYIEKARKSLASEGQAQTSAAEHPLSAALTDSEKVLHKVIDSLQKKLIAMQINRNEWKKIAETQGDLHAAQLVDTTAPGEDGQSDSFKLAEVLRGLGIGADVAGHSAASLYVIARAIQAQAKSAAPTVQQSISPFMPLPAMSQFATLDEYKKAMDAYDADMRNPTAQQSLTAGGAVRSEQDVCNLLREKSLLTAKGLGSVLNGDFVSLNVTAITAIVNAAAPLPQVQPSEAVRDVLAERQRQIKAEGWSTRHDDHHDENDLARAAACYAYPELTAVPDLNAWPWTWGWWKPRDQRFNLVRAGALILAEIERLDRAADQQPITPSGALGDSKGGVKS